MSDKSGVKFNNMERWLFACVAMSAIVNVDMCKDISKICMDEKKEEGGLMSVALSTNYGSV